MRHKILTVLVLIAAWAWIPCRAAADATLNAAPNPCVIPAQALICATVVSWSTEGLAGTSQVWVSMDGAQETLFACDVSGSQDAAWIQAGHSYEFRLYPASDCGAGAQRGFKLVSVLVTAVSVNTAPPGGGAWGAITVDASGETGYNPSMALDSNGNPHIVYNDWGQGDLRYAYWNGASWVLESVATEGSVGGTPSLVIGSQGALHVSYYDFDRGDLWYARRTTGTWIFELVDSSGEAGLWSSLAIGADGQPRVAYQNLTPGSMGLRYAQRNPAGVWVTETVDAGLGADVGQFSSLAIDPSGAAHVAYLDFTNFDLKHAYQDASCSNSGCGNPWIIETVDAAGWPGFYASLKIDSAGTLHAAHQDALAQNLRYSQKRPGANWQSYDIDSAGDVGSYASLALDQNGLPRVAYYDSTNLKLKYARFNGSSWDVSTISPSGAESWNTSIRVDAQGNPHVAYLDWLKGDLKYARWSNAPVLSWTGETGYQSDGIEPNEGNSYTKFIFRVRYSDPDGDPILEGFPRLHVRQGASEIGGSPYALNFYQGPGGSNFYEYALWLGPGSDYSYFFEAKDRWGVQAIGEPTFPKGGPVVRGDSLGSIQNEVFTYPNPARSGKVTFRVTVGYLQPKMEIRIFDLAGQTIRSVADGSFDKSRAPFYEYAWDTADERGQDVASGVYGYFVRVRDESTGREFKTVKKLAIIK